MAKYQKYAEYKDSGVEWLGEIPQEWSIVSIARVSNKITNGYVGATRDIFYDTGIRYLQSLHIKKNKINFHTPYYVSEDWSNEKSKSILKEGDVLIVQTGDIGQVAAVTKEFEGCNCHALIIVSGNEKIWGFYLSWLLNSDYGRQTLKSIQTGALHPHLNCDAIKDVKITLPDIQIQKNISNFLDHETAKIDTLIAKQEKLIELLKEKRQAVISHAVTKGLNPNVPMKDSGVEWLGVVPEHWDITKLKWKAITTSGSTPTTSKYELYYENGNIPWIRTTDLNNGDLYETPVSITQRAVNDSACSVLPVNSILIAMYGGAGSIGKHSLLKFESTINQAVCGVLPSKFFNADFLHRFYEFYRPFWMIGAAGTRKDPNIGQDHIKESIVPSPPLEEQVKIAEYILEIQTKYDDLTKKAESAIQLMQERRTALISAAVTGKIDVRNWQHPNQKNNNNTELSA